MMDYANFHANFVVRYYSCFVTSINLTKVVAVFGFFGVKNGLLIYATAKRLANCNY